MRGLLIGGAKVLGVACAGLAALYWASFAAAKLGNWMVRVGLWRTDAVGVPVHPSAETGAPMWVVVTFWAVTVLGLLAGAWMATSMVARLAARHGQPRRP